MARSKTSADWLKEHIDDIYVQKAQQDGYRTRASYKLIELDERDQLLRSGMTVIDLGSAPGGWSQVVAQRLGDKGLVIASDILPMDAIADVTFIQGDFTTDEVFDELLTAINDRPVDLVISDMAPNMSVGTPFSSGDNALKIKVSYRHVSDCYFRLRPIHSASHCHQR